ncbi:KaiC domain-containing protein [Natrialbaceae archaeon A-chndr2]
MTRELEEDWFERAIGEGASEGKGDAEQSDATDAEMGTERGDAADEDETRDVGASSEPLFDDDFGSALEGVELPDLDDADGSGDAIAGFEALDFDLGPQGESDFDAELETNLPRIDLGIDGLDRMIHGGVPERSLIVAMGSAGTGKTTFGLQFLNHGLAQGERAVYFTLEESRNRVINSATEKGFPFDEYIEEERLAVVDIDPIEMANSLTSIRNELPRLIEEFGASRLVLDSVSLLEMMYDDRAKRRNEIYDFTRSLKKAGVTSLLTSEASESSPYASRYGIVEYLTDAVFVLQYVRPDDFRETRMAVEIQKIRDANHSRDKKPYEITEDGISVYQQANLF